MFLHAQGQYQQSAALRESALGIYQAAGEPTTPTPPSGSATSPSPTGRWAGTPRPCPGNSRVQQITAQRKTPD
jgi:hypothetical protein